MHSGTAQGMKRANAIKSSDVETHLVHYEILGCARRAIVDYERSENGASAKVESDVACLTLFEDFGK